ncbi:MAG: hypothetical protein ACRDQ1_02140 [Sciscionella sp.]
MTEPTVRHPHGGVEWDIPVDLLGIQRRFDEADAECARLVDGEDRDAYQAARTRRLHEALALHDHPWLLEQMAQGRRYQADMALKHLARSAPH